MNADEGGIAREKARKKNRIQNETQSQTQIATCIDKVEPKPEGEKNCEHPINQTEGLTAKYTKNANKGCEKNPPESHQIKPAKKI